MAAEPHRPFAFNLVIPMGIDEKMWHFRTAGLAALVVRDGEVLWTNGYGYADIAEQIPVTPDTVFHVGSISKTVVATAVMQLWEDGEFDLDDDVNDYLAFSVRSPHFPAAPITFRMLLEHSSGMTRFGAFQNLAFLELGADSAVSLEDYLASHLDSEGELYEEKIGAIFSASEPGAKFEYNNIGYGLLGHLVERISGIPFDVYCTLNIFGPLGMDRTTWRIADLAEAGIEAAVPYGWSHTSQSYEVFFGHHSFTNYAAAGLRTSANDLAKFLLAHMNGGSYGGATILQPDTVAIMHARHRDAPPAGGWSWGYGFGFEIAERGPQQEQPTVGHGGQTLGSATEMRFRPDAGVGVIVLANAPGPIITPAGVKSIPGRELAVYSFLPERLLDEAAAAP